MTPTNKLRWVDRETGDHALVGSTIVAVRETVLQQWWEIKSSGVVQGNTVRTVTQGEWRDVPVEKDQ
jgi:hypothetical protein